MDISTKITKLIYSLILTIIKLSLQYKCEKVNYMLSSFNAILDDTRTNANTGTISWFVHECPNSQQSVANVQTVGFAQTTEYLMAERER